MKPKVSEKQIIKALEKAGGFISYAAKMLGVTSSAISQRVSSSKNLQKKLEEIKCGYLDLAEHELLKKIRGGDNAAIFFYLKCQGKERGYIERQEVTGKNGGPIEGKLPGKIEIEFV